ncbi:MAG: integrase [Hyphomicrobiales bacterium]|nr:MAG: integrase [Hyphomicrobiales bacterium]
MTKGKTTKITKSIVDRLQPNQIVWDSEVKGFGVRRQTNAKKYVLKARIKGRQKWFTIGEHGSPWTVVNARKQAQRLLADIYAGKDLVALREAKRDQVLISDLCDRYLKDYAEIHKKPSSYNTDRKNIQNHVLPLIGNIPVQDVTREDIDRFKNDIRNGKTAAKNPDGKREYRGGAVVTGGPGVANRCLALVSKMFNLAERWNLRPDGSNPAHQVTRFKENKCERYLSTEEFERLGEILNRLKDTDQENPYAIAAIRLLIFTGARLGEILNLKWEHVDLEKEVLNLPDSKTGKKSIFLSPPAVEVLRNLPKLKNNPFVIVGGKEGKNLINLQKPWNRIRKLCGLEDVRIHDLRHSFASIAVASGMSLPVIGKLMGHKKSVTTERYAHLASGTLQTANKEIGKQLSDILSWQKT